MFGRRKYFSISLKIKFLKTRELISAIRLYCSDKHKCIELYGEPNNWDVSNITNMRGLFSYTLFDVVEVSGL
jgi:hypothetical protein